MRFYVTLDTFRRGISLHARDMFVGQHVGIVDRNISHLGTFIYYVSTEVRVDVHQHVNVASLSVSYRYYFGRCSSELAQLVPLPYSRGRSTGHSDRLH